MIQDVDVAIVGGGPAGLTAATYLRRFLRSVVVIDAGRSRARYIPESHNCPGFPQGVSGTGLLRRMREQADAFEVDVTTGCVDAIACEGETFVVAAAGRRWRAHKVILATGLADRLPEVPWAEEAIACGALRLCAICDAYEASDQAIAVYGPGAQIGGHAEFLRSYSARITLLPSDDDLAHPAIDRARALGATLLPPGGTLEFDGEHCHYRTPDGDVHRFDTVYPYLGYEGGPSLPTGLGLDSDGSGALEVDAHQQTRVPGLYAVGDVVSGLNQISVAVGHAAIAATHAHNTLPFVPRTPGDGAGG
ncbi:NAD(P)/FAD-dependent oxidoreductase [Luteimonas sp. FCS-9]|uniref:NAD(P)/FAD-dependent oxidoreductase n=1 Tax=Luteimonas sp. FCS-9 TaxID=1547516 RepID=UPI00063E7710|nr:NAD(P)/FAD-dependent oxidoreductase [Luteimonas sp. FCS-9]KLI97479.1 pyridine nucleotide-disulfide oxidoreductase [Luteimonas sp. FCS-9]